MSATVEKWGVFETTLHGRADGNPFTDYDIQAVFRHKSETVTVDGFYDGVDGKGRGVYKVRFMPRFEGWYEYEVKGSYSGEAVSGGFSVSQASKDNHGPVRVANTYHFAYEDGTPYYPVGTTCYVWELQSEGQQKKTLATLSKGFFNKIRFCVFPKHYDYNFHEPCSYPYEGTAMDSSVLTKENFGEYTVQSADQALKQGNKFDFSRFNTEHFRHVEKSIEALRDRGVEADLIVMHPYDRWGFSTMTKGEDDLYWKYVVARFSAYRNIWWSLANEYDLFPAKTLADWERYASIICAKDPYGHLRGIHNCVPFYDHGRPWVTHCCIQRQDIYKCAELVAEYRAKWGKPVVLDEISYEGDIQHGWGNIGGKELVRRFWEAACRGGYAGPGETYLGHTDDEGRPALWWSHGGELYGESAPRLRFLHGILRETPGLGLAPMETRFDEIAARPDETFPKTGYYLFYYSFMRPSFRDYYFDDENDYEVEVIDTWEMTVEKRGAFRGRFTVELPGKEFMAVRIRAAR
jgi:hypothetical protein